MTDVIIYVCKECANNYDWKDATQSGGDDELCSACDKLCNPENLVCKLVRRREVFWLEQLTLMQERRIKEYEERVTLIEDQIKCLENHIKFAPGGEEAMAAIGRLYESSGAKHD